MKSVFSSKVRELHWSRDIQTLNWDFVIQIFKNVEHIRSIIISINSSQTLIVQFISNFSDSDQWSRSQQSWNQSYSLSDQSQNDNWNQDFNNHQNWNEKRNQDRNQDRDKDRNHDYDHEN